MEVNEVKLGQIFTIDNTFSYPKLKLRKGFIDMRTRYIYYCKGKTEARLLLESQLRKIMSDWRMSPEKFDEYKGDLIKKYEVEV